MADLFFCPERWEPEASISTNAAKAVRVKSYSGQPTEAWQLGDWGGSWTAITSKIPIETGWLESGADYRFCFWLNGGENSRGTEVCTLEIFGDDWEDRLCFRLNREHTRPLLEKNGWLLFAVPFKAPAATTALTFRFVACSAVCTVAGIPDMDMAACEDLTPDERITDRPQRHNLVFPGGYPEDPHKKVVLKARGKEVSLSVKALGIAAAVSAAAGIFALCRAMRKKK